MSFGASVLFFNFKLSILKEIYIPLKMSHSNFKTAVKLLVGIVYFVATTLVVHLFYGCVLCVVL